MMQKVASPKRPNFVMSLIVAQFQMINKRASKVEMVKANLAQQLTEFRRSVQIRQFCR